MLGLGVASGAQAASWVNVSGTVYEGGAWFTSSAVRTVTSGGSTMQLSLSQIPSKGIQWNLIKASTGAVFSSTKTWSSTGAQTLASNVAVGTLFQNHFRQNSNCNLNCGSYNFSGQEWY